MKLVTIQTRVGTSGLGAFDPNTNTLYLQRQGIGSELGGGCPEFCVSVNGYRQGVEFRFGDSDTRNFIPLPKGLAPERIGEGVRAALDVVERKVEEVTGTKYVISNQFVSYMYHGRNADGGRNEPILSPILYEAYTDTIRLAPQNYCLVAFPNKSFADRYTEMDKAASPYLQFIDMALRNGFHSCDFARGDDYCKRRLAWLAGQYMMQSADGVMNVALLNADMEHIKR